jgi:KDO2-lipid IV(A) lauroyltransferase
MLEYLYVGLYYSFSFLLRILPQKVRFSLMAALARFTYWASKKHQKIISSNLDIAFSPPLEKEEKKRIGEAAFMNFIDTLFGIMKRDGMSKEAVIENVTFEGEEIIEAYQKEGKSFILITGHYGNWELLSQSIAIQFNLNLVGVGRKIDSKKMDAILKKNRERFNVEMIYKKGAMKGCIKAISQKKVVGILTDQAIRKNQSIDVDFFSKRATHTPLASILSRKFGLDLVPAYISTEDYRNYKVTIYPPIETLKTQNQEKDLARLTQAQAEIMEKVISKNPEQWFWMHRRWKGMKNAV